MDTNAGMKRAFRNRAFPIFESLGLPLIELPEMNCLGASPMKATTFSTRSHLSNIWSSARMAAMVASPILRNRLQEVPLCFQFRVVFYVCSNLFLKTLNLLLQVSDMVPK